VHFVILECTNACRSLSKCFRPQLKPVAKRSCSEVNVAVTLVAIRLAHALHIPDQIRFTLWVARHLSRFGSQHRAPSENVSASLKAVLRDTDTNGVYFVLTSADVNESSGFCKKYCGWHTSAIINGLDIKYAFVGNADRCPKNCAPQTTSPPTTGGCSQATPHSRKVCGRRNLQSVQVASGQTSRPHASKRSHHHCRGGRSECHARVPVP
jgi:hypothetical protein